MNYINIYTNFLVSFPFFFVWLSTIFLWGLLEIYSLGSHFFNSKHSYLNLLNKENIFLTIFSFNIKTFYSSNFFKIFFKKYI